MKGTGARWHLRRAKTIRGGRWPIGHFLILTALAGGRNEIVLTGGGAANNGRYGDTVILTARQNAPPPTQASVATWTYAAQTHGRYGDTVILTLRAV